MRQNHILRLCACPLVFLACLFLLKASYGVAVFPAGFAAAACFPLCLREVLIFRGLGKGRLRTWCGKFTLTIGAVAMVMMAFEGYLQIEKRSIERAILEDGDAGRLSSPATMPEEWEKRFVEVSGARTAYFWHGHLHLFDENNMRRSEPFPPKSEGVCRIMLVGDSLTYGQGVAMENVYGSVLERELRKDYRVEVLNLGVLGLQSEDVRNAIERFLPILEPDLVVYGICLNDFLPSGRLESWSRERWEFPLPERVRRFFLVRTLTGKFVERQYHNVLMSLGLRATFTTDVLKNHGLYQNRFAKDLATMNGDVTRRGLPPVVAMALHQSPREGSDLNRIASIVEKLALEAGMTVVPSASYFGVHDGKSLRVSPWEGHPSAECHRIFAENLLAGIEKLPVLETYGK